jgi:hypothetical protein
MASLKANQAEPPCPAASTLASPSTPPPRPEDPAVDEKLSPMEVDCPVEFAATATPTPIKKKKKKKQSYKNLMTSMMTGDSSRDVLQQEREKISKGVGGGSFTKIEKI